MAERTNPFTFLQQVRAETAKVVWPSRRETGDFDGHGDRHGGPCAAIFFLLADQVMSCGVTFASRHRQLERAGG